MKLIHLFLLSAGISQINLPGSFCSAAAQQHILSNAFKIDTARTVAIYSSDNSFFEDYPVDSLVEHLNLLNENAAILFCRNTNDNSRTGLGADFLVDLKFSAGKIIYQAPEVKTVRKSRPVMRAIQEPGGSVRHELGTEYYNEEDVQSREPLTVKTTITVQVFQKNPYRKIKPASIEYDAGSGNEPELIINLIYHLLARFNKN
jgi:hypothetical protein